MSYLIFVSAAIATAVFATALGRFVNRAILAFLCWKQRIKKDTPQATPVFHAKYSFQAFAAFGFVCTADFLAGSELWILFSCVF
jgi:hypothetical protein